MEKPLVAWVRIATSVWSPARIVAGSSSFRASAVIWINAFVFS